MKKLFPALLLLAISFAGYPRAHAQKAGTVTLHGLGPLQTPEGFIGYYTLLQTDKPEKGKTKYSLLLLDPSLNRVAEKELIEDEGFRFAASAFDGQHILLKYLGPAEDGDDLTLASAARQLVRIYDTKLNQVKTRTSTIDRLFVLPEPYQFGQRPVHGLEPAPGGGFASFTMINTQPAKGIGGSQMRQGFMVEYIPTEPTAAGWRYKSPEKNFELHHYIGQSPRHVFVSTMHKEKLFDWSLDYDIVGYDRAANGRRTWRQDTSMRNYSLVPAAVTFVPGSANVLMSGVYFEKEGGKSNVFAKSAGIFAYVADSTGKATTSTTLMPWSELAKDAGEGGRLYIQHAVRTADGRAFLIGERFKVGVSTSVGNLLSRVNSMGTTGAKRVKVGDLVILELSPELKLQKVHTFDKPGRDVDLLSAIGAPSAEFQLYAEGSRLDYQFTQLAGDGQSFAVYYDIPKTASSSDLGAVVFSDGKFSKDVLPLNRADRHVTLLPNVFGSVGIFEYNKKEKRMDQRVVKVNY